MEYKNILVSKCMQILFSFLKNLLYKGVGIFILIL